MDNKNYLLALNRMKPFSARTRLKLIVRWPSLDEMFRLTIEQLQQAGVSYEQAVCIKQFNMQEIEEDLKWQSLDKNNYLISLFDPEYPALLKEIHDPPLILYAKGNLASLTQKTVAIVGSRKPSITGAETAKKFAFELALAHLTIVSGLAYGIDAHAHQGCLAAEGKTIAVMGTGIDRIYPLEHRQLAEVICHNGLIISEFPLKTPPKAGHFPQRNRIISGLSLAILVVEAAIRSGSLITARLALEQNRDVLAIPSSIHNPQARGCHYLLQQGAKLVTSSQDIREELGLAREPNISASPQSLARSDKNLVKFIGFEMTTVDQIIKRSELSVEEVACQLATLEIDGIIRAVPGGYMRCS